MKFDNYLSFDTIVIYFVLTIPHFLKAKKKFENSNSKENSAEYSNPYENQFVLLKTLKP